MKTEKIEDYLYEITEDTCFCCSIAEENEKTIELDVHGDNPEGEDWWMTISIRNPKNKKELIEELSREFTNLYQGFDIEENVYLMLGAKRNGFRGVPGVDALVENEKYKENALKEFSEKLQDMI